MSTHETTFEAGLVPASMVDNRPQAALPVAAIEQYRALARRLDVERRAGLALRLVRPTVQPIRS